MLEWLQKNGCEEVENKRFGRKKIGISWPNLKGSSAEEQEDLVIT
jgi:hypothetical protein